MILTNENVDEKNINFFMNVGNIHYFCKKLKKKKQGGKYIYWFILKNLTHEMLKSHFKLYFIIH
jgi:hypothetical protein